MVLTRAYSSLNNEGHIHSTVNHQKWFIDPDTNGMFVENTEKAI